MKQSKKPRTVPFRRKREKKTDYKKRLHLLLSGKPRIVVRFTNSRIIAQVVKFTAKGDEVIAGVDSFALKKLGWNYSCKNFPAAYLTGLLIAKASLKKNEKEAVLDTGFRSPLHKGKIYAFLKGVADGGLEVPFDEKVLPEDDIISGQHIADYANMIKDNKEQYEKRFANYLKNNANPENLVAEFNKIKQGMMSN